MTDASFWIVQTLNALQLSMLLFLLSVGLTVILGLLHFVNLAHGSFYALGAYVAVTAAGFTGSYWGGFLAAPLLVALVGFVLYVVLISRLRTAGPMNQVLVTLGLIFIFLDVFRLIWGDLAVGTAEPALFTGRTEAFGIVYPTYRLFIIVLGLAVMAVLALVLARTSVGAIVRAGVDNADMAACLGINVERVFFIVFCVGCALAGLAGAIAAPIFSASTDMGTSILVATLIVVVIGGMGSLKGAIAGSFLVGFIQTFGAVIAPQLASIAVYAMLAAVLILRPKGLFPARA